MRGGISNLWELLLLSGMCPIEPAAPAAGSGTWEPWEAPEPARAVPADLISTPGLELTGSSVFGFPFNIPRLRSPRLHANIQPLLPLLFSKKEKHCEKRLQRFLGSFQSGEAALGAALPAHSAGSDPAWAVIPRVLHPRASRKAPLHSASAGYGGAIKSF